MRQEVLNVLEDLYKLREQTGNKFWNISWEVGQFLHETILSFKPDNILEIGTSTGFSAVWMASAAESYGGELITIDSARKRIAVALDSFVKSGLQNIKLLRGHAPEVFENFEESVKFDLIFIDASKKDYIKFYQLLKPFFAENTIIIADNISSHLHFVEDYLELVRAENYSVFVDLDDGLEVTFVQI